MMPNRNFQISAVAVFTAMVVCAADNAPKAAHLTLEDLVEAQGVQAPTLSPDGQWFALPWQGQIVLTASQGGWPIPLTSTTGGKSGLDWSSDGGSLAFASGGAIWTVPSAGGQPVRLTEGVRGAGDPRRASDSAPQWSPKGNWILFETGRRGNGDLALVSRDGLTTTLLTSSRADEGSAAWSPDGTRIAFVERSEEHFSGRLRVGDLDTASGRFHDETRVLYDAPADRGGGWSIRRPVWSPDGKSLAVVLQTTGWDKIWLIPATGGAPRALTTGESEDEPPVWAPDGKHVAFVSNRDRREERRVWIVGADGGAPRRLTTDSEPAVEGNPRWSPDGKLVYFSRSTAFEPGGLSAAPADGGPSRVVIRTQPRTFTATGLDAPEAVRYHSKDGREIAAILHKPLHYQAGTRYPAVLWIHGGPEGQDTVGWDPWALYLAQKGYVVLRPNYRGSNGYGEKFRNANVEDSGGGELDDVVAGVEYLVSHGIADRSRIAIGGGSHGGTMVAYAVTKRPDLFRAAIELYGVVDRATFIERTNRPSAIRWMAKMGGAPEEKPEVYQKANILPDVPKIKAPLLIMHGEDDPQVPPYESQQFVAALKKAGKPYLYFTYPKELHGFTQKEHRLDAWKKQEAFLARYLQPEYGRSITSTADVVLEGK
jgi:dipeptidyl aminopeptidase/acylaminoacyl peptidase